MNRIGGQSRLNDLLQVTAPRGSITQNPDGSVWLQLSADIRTTRWQDIATTRGRLLLPALPSGYLVTSCGDVLVNPPGKTGKYFILFIANVLGVLCKRSLNAMKRLKKATLVAVTTFTAGAVGFYAPTASATVAMSGGGSGANSVHKSTPVERTVLPQKGSHLVQTWAGCGIFDSKDKVVRQFSRIHAHPTGANYFATGRGTLACGSSTWGYRHVLERRQQDWQNRANLAGQNWRDVADYGIMWAFKNPQYVTYRSQNDTYCYGRTMYLQNLRTHKIVGSYQATVTVSHRLQNIITAYPPTKRYCKNS